MTMTKTKQYTAQEKREMAENIIMLEDDWIEDAAHMLRQAADEMERKKKYKYWDDGRNVRCGFISQERVPGGV